MSEKPRNRPESGRDDDQNLGQKEAEQEKAELEEKDEEDRDDDELEPMEHQEPQR